VLEPPTGQPAGGLRHRVSRDRRGEEDPLNAPPPDPFADLVPAVAPDDDGAVQLLAPDGSRRTDERWPASAPGSDTEIAQLRHAYRDMVATRLIDTEATALQRQGELALWASAQGQEAAQIGAGHALARQDHVFPSYREHGIARVRGVGPLEILSLFRGVDFGGWDPVATGFHQYSLVVAAQALQAVGYAMAVARDGRIGSGEPASTGRDIAVLGCFGDGATAEGDVNEALVWAGTQRPPVVLFCQNNQWAISQPVSRQAGAPLWRRAAGFGVPGVRVDGNDVLACRAVLTAALDRARSGGGPSFVEAFTFRVGAHTTADDATRYRSADEVDLWAARDPLARVRTRLEHLDALDADYLAAIDDECADLARSIRRGIRELPDPQLSRVFAHGWSRPPEGVVIQERDYRALLDSYALDAAGAGAAAGTDPAAVR